MLASRLLAAIHKRAAAAIGVAVIGVMSGAIYALIHYIPTPGPLPVYAEACGASSTCLNGNTKGLASITVRHDYTDVAVSPVRVDSTAEEWDVTAHWLTSDQDSCSCDEVTAGATVDVDWNPVTKDWDVTCTNGCNAGGPIYDVVDACIVSNCNGSDTKPYSYRLILQMDRRRTIPCGQGASPAYLNRVEFETTHLSNGTLYTMPECGTGAVVGPTQPSFSTNDYGDWECDTSCSNARGPEISIFYGP